MSNCQCQPMINAVDSIHVGNYKNSITIVNNWIFNELADNSNNKKAIPTKVNHSVFEDFRYLYAHDLEIEEVVQLNESADKARNIKGTKIRLTHKIIEKLKSMYTGTRFNRDLEILSYNYGAFIPGNNELSLNADIRAKLTDLSFTFELFSAPYNLSENTTGYCSPFAIDTKFGSSGNAFFINPLVIDKGVYANTPFTNHILYSTVILLDQWKQDYNISSIMIGPAWEDAEWFERLQQLADITIVTNKVTFRRWQNDKDINIGKAVIAGFCLTDDQSNFLNTLY